MWPVWQAGAVATLTCATVMTCVALMMVPTAGACLPLRALVTLAVPSISSLLTRPCVLLVVKVTAIVLASTRLAFSFFDQEITSVKVRNLMPLTWALTWARVIVPFTGVMMNLWAKSACALACSSSKCAGGRRSARDGVGSSRNSNSRSDENCASGF